MGVGKLLTISRRNHAAAIVYAALDKRIAGIKIVLRRYIDDTTLNIILILQKSQSILKMSTLFY